MLLSWIFIIQYCFKGQEGYLKKQGMHPLYFGDELQCLVSRNSLYLPRLTQRRRYQSEVTRYDKEKGNVLIGTIPNIRKVIKNGVKSVSFSSSDPRISPGARITFALRFAFHASDNEIKPKEGGFLAANGLRAVNLGI